jgi:hypothetical protein
MLTSPFGFQYDYALLFAPVVIGYLGCLVSLFWEFGQEVLLTYFTKTVLILKSLSKQEFYIDIIV